MNKSKKVKSLQTLSFLKKFFLNLGDYTFSCAGHMEGYLRDIQNKESFF